MCMDVRRHHCDCQQNDLFPTPSAPSAVLGPMRARSNSMRRECRRDRYDPGSDSDAKRRVGNDSTLPQVKARGRRRTPRGFQTQGSTEPTRLRNHQERLGRPTRTYAGMRGPARRQERLNSHHGLPDGSGHHSQPPWIGWMAQNGPDVMGFGLLRSLPPKVRSGGPGEQSGGSVRPRGRSLQPTRARTAPTAMHAISPARERG